MKEALEHNANDGQALAFLEERHRELLEGVVFQDDAEEQSNAEQAPAAADGA